MLAVMSGDQIRTILRKTMEDSRVSRGEKRVLESTLRELGAGDHELALIRSQAFDLARSELLSPEAKAVLDWLEDVNKVLQRQRANGEEPRPAGAYFSPGPDCLYQIVELLRESRRTADICVFTITDDRISDAIIAAKQRKVDVRVITDNDKSVDRGSDVGRLTRHGISVRMDQTEYHMHHKFAIFDRSTLATGSYNWTRSAAERNEENLVVTQDARLTKQFSGVFEDLWRELA